MQSASVEHASGGQGSSAWHWFGGSPDGRLEQEIGELEIRLQDARTDTEAQRLALDRALAFVASAKAALRFHWARNEQAWAWFHAARREEPRLWRDVELAVREVDLREEVQEKLKSWRLKAALNYACSGVERLEAVVGMQQHLDEVAENDNRKRIHQRRQLIIYLAVLFVVLVAICAVEFRGDGLLLGDNGRNNWWLISAVLYGTLGGAFSSAQRVAAAGPAAKYPELRWARVANILRPLAGGAGALVAFAAIEADALGGDVRTSGAHIATVSFVAGFSERFIPSIAARQESSK